MVFWNVLNKMVPGQVGNYTNLPYEGKNSLAIPTFEGLQAPKHLANLTPLPHQLEVAKASGGRNEWKSDISR